MNKNTHEFHDDCELIHKNTKSWSMQNYLLFAKNLGYLIKILNYYIKYTYSNHSLIFF
jgi:hypothetical protein